MTPEPPSDSGSSKPLAEGTGPSLVLRTGQKYQLQLDCQRVTWTLELYGDPRAHAGQRYRLSSRDDDGAFYRQALTTDEARREDGRLVLDFERVPAGMPFRLDVQPVSAPPEKVELVLQGTIQLEEPPAEPPAATLEELARDLLGLGGDGDRGGEPWGLDPLRHLAQQLEDSLRG